MSAHRHPQHVPGCYRCELSREEAFNDLVQQRDELDAENTRLRALIAVYVAANDAYDVDVQFRAWNGTTVQAMEAAYVALRAGIEGGPR